MNFIKIILKPFQNPQIGINPRFENSQMYKKFSTFDKNWTPIEQKLIEIQIDSNPIHTIIKIQFPIQLVVGHIIHHA